MRGSRPPLGHERVHERLHRGGARTAAQREHLEDIGLDARIDEQRTHAVPVPGSSETVRFRTDDPFENAFKGSERVRWGVLAGFPLLFVTLTVWVQSRKGRS